MNVAMAEKTQDKILTAQGLALKGVAKIQRIDCEASHKDVILRTWQFGRMVRRDFNLLSYKLFFAVRRKGDLPKRVTRALLDLEEAAEVLVNMTRKDEIPRPPEDCTSLTLRIVSDECERLIDALVAADRALAKMNVSAMAEVADENCNPVYIAYARLKNLVLEPPPEGARGKAD